MKQVYVKTRAEWRKWLSQNHDKNTGIWLVFYKKHTKKPTLEYNESVEEALCFGWIDSIIKKIDDERYVRKFTPRKPESRWSELNKKRVAKLIKNKQMTQSGMVRVQDAKRSGHWMTSSQPTPSFEIPTELEKALLDDKKAKSFFDTLTPSYKKQYIGWIVTAKREETKSGRLAEAISLLRQGKKLGMK